MTGVDFAARTTIAGVHLSVLVQLGRMVLSRVDGSGHGIIGAGRDERRLERELAVHFDRDPVARSQAIAWFRRALARYRSLAPKPAPRARGAWS